MMTGQKPTTTMDANWLSTEISKLLVSPHISFPKPPAGIRLGPGPVDLFSTVFNNIFAPDVVATVDGEKVSRDELKQKLLNLQKHWKSDEVKVQEEPPRGKVSRCCCGRSQV